MGTAAVIGMGQLGSETARRLLADGHDVRCLALDPARAPADVLAGARVQVGDRGDARVLADFVGAGVDVLVDTVAFTSYEARQLVGHAGDIGAAAVVSSVAVYRDREGLSVGCGEPRFAGPLREDGPLVAATDETYGGGKVLVERIVLEEMGVPVVVVRPAALCGPGSRHLREWWFVKRILDGRGFVPLRDRGRSRFHTSTTANVAALMLHGLGSGVTGVYNAGDPDAPTVHQIAEGVAGAMSHSWNLVLMAEKDTSSVGDSPWSAEHPIVLDTSAATEAGFRPPTSYDDALPALVSAALDEVGTDDWRLTYPDLAAYPTDQFDYAAEDDWLRLWESRTGELRAPPADWCGVGPLHVGRRSR